MTINSPKRQAPKPNLSVIEWLLDSDLSIRWQVMRNLIDAQGVLGMPVLLAIDAPAPMKNTSERSSLEK